MQTFGRLALMALAACSLAACGDRANKTDSTTVAATPAPASGRTLAATLQSSDGHAALAKVLANAGLGPVLEGVGPYTVLAPADAALGQAGANLADPALKAESAALIRAHILPGALTRADIAAAVDRSGGKGAQMRTMAGELVTFARDGQTLTAATADGTRVRLTGSEVLASNGVLQPVDALLVRPTAATE